MDCTFCLECVHACPHENIGLLVRPPAQELWEDPQRAGVGRFSRRPDLAALALFLTFAAFMNAFGMVSPVYALEAWLSNLLGTTSGPVLIGLIFLGGMILIPGVLIAGTAWASSALAGSGRDIIDQATRYGYALVPLGFGMWVAHYLFHFLIGGLSIVPLTQDYLAFLGLTAGAGTTWTLGPLVPEAWLIPIEILFLELGLLVTLVVAYRIGEREEGSGAPALRAALPWGMVAVALSVLGAWLLLQPMEMRGTLMGG